MAECVSEYFYMGRFIFEGLLFWCPTNFQHARLNFCVCDHDNIFARLMGLCVTLLTLLSIFVTSSRQLNALLRVFHYEQQQSFGRSL
jgi:hypothetical protein